MKKSASAHEREVSKWTARELQYLKNLKTPFGIQRCLETYRYRAESVYCCPRQVMREKRAHCFDGALFAAAALRVLGHPPLIIDLRSAENDDDHVLAVFKHRGCWGAIGKSNYVCLAWREPIYRNLRELSISYFEMYFNLAREKTLREYSVPLDLSRYDKQFWTFRNDSLAAIAEDLDDGKHFDLLSKTQVRELQKTDVRTFKAGTLGTDKKGCY